MSNNLNNDHIESYISRLKRRVQFDPTNTRLRNSLDRAQLLYKQLQLTRQEVKRQRNLGIPVPASQTPEQKKKINNFFTKKAKNQLAINKQLESLNQNIRTAKVPAQVKTLKNIKQGIKNSQQTVSNTTGFPIRGPTISPYPIRIGGKTRRVKRKSTRRH